MLTPQPSALNPALFPRAIPYPAELPLARRAALAGMPVSFTLPRQVKLRLRSPEKITGADWAARYRIVTDGAHEGQWRHEYAPHTVKIMDTFTRPWVREIWFCGVEQSGKTNTMLNCLGWCIDCDPGNIFYLMPTEATADKVTGEKLRPTLTRSPRLARYISRRQDDTTQARIKLSHGVTLWPAHANSASSMATWAAKHCFGDEVDKYPPMVGKESDPITLIKKRNRTYKGRYKRFFASTPAGLYIQKGMRGCHQVWEYRNRCPHCGELIRMDGDHLVIPEDATPQSLELTGCAYACNNCGAEWSERDRERAIRAGGWICVQGEDESRPAKVGFHHRAWDCLDIPLAEIGAAWLKAKPGDHAAKIAWANGYEAVDYAAEHQTRKEDAILALRDDRPAGVVPSGGVVACLLAGVDTQDNGFWYEIRAFGYGQDHPSWGVRAGFVDSAAALEAVLFSHLYLDVDGNSFVVRAAVIDAMGHRTAEVYDLGRAHPGRLFPLKGEQRMSAPHTWSNIEYYPGTKKPITGGLKLLRVHTGHFKDVLAAKLAVAAADPGAWLLHSDYTEAWASHLCAEFINEAGAWECPSGKANHGFDCGVYLLALADVLGVKFWPSPDTAEAQTSNKKPTTSKQTRW